MTTQMSSTARPNGTGRSTRNLAAISATAWWQISAAVAVGASALAVATGRGLFGWIFAFWAIMSLYGSIDHLVAPVVAEVVGPADAVAAPAPVALTPRQHRVLRFIAFGLPEDEIAELLLVEVATVRSDVDGIVSTLGIERSQVIEVARNDLLGKPITAATARLAA